MAAYLDVCRFLPTAGGTTDWTYSSAVVGYQSPTAAGVVNSSVYRYRAESSDLSQWEIGYGAYNTGTGVLARTTVLFNSSATGTGAGQSGAGTKINFAAVPQVAIVALAEDLVADINEAWTSYTPTITAQSGTFTTVSATGRYKIIGKTVFVTITITITTAGTAAGAILATLPVNVGGSFAYMLPGRENALTGNMLQALTSTVTQVSINTFNNGSPIATGNSVIVSGQYESA